MGDIKLFKTDGATLSLLRGFTEGIEKTLQNRFEQNLEVLLGVKFLVSEYVTSNGGRMDTLGIDENGFPVIIEYKRQKNENIINQGLFYLDWLLDHRGDFEIIVRDKIGVQAAKAIEWGGARLICVASDFTKYDVHAVNQMGKNIDLIRYLNFDNDLLLLDQLTATSSPVTSKIEVWSSNNGPHKNVKYKTTSEYFEDASDELKILYSDLENFLLSMNDDVTKSVLKFYVAFKRLKNFACVEIKPTAEKILVYLNVDPSWAGEMEDGFLRDVSKIGHFGTGNLEVTIRNRRDFERAQPLIMMSYENS